MERLHLKRNLVLSAAKANEEPKTSKLTRSDLHHRAWASRTKFIRAGEMSAVCYS